MDTLHVFRGLILLLRFFRFESLGIGLVVRGVNVQRGLVKLIISFENWEWVKLLLVGWLQGVRWSTIRLMRHRATAAHAPLPDLT